MNWQAKVFQSLLLLIAVAVVARVVSGLLGPLLGPLLLVVTFGGLLAWLVKGPHARH